MNSRVSGCLNVAARALGNRVLDESSIGRSGKLLKAPRNLVRQAECKSSARGAFMFSGEMIESFLMIAAISAMFIGYGIWAGRKEDTEQPKDTHHKQAA